MHIIEFVFSVTECTSTLTLTKTPNKPQVDTKIVFSYVGNVLIKRYHNPEDCFGDYTGLNVKQLTTDRSEFMIDTGDALVTFEASSTYKTNKTNPL